MNPTTSILFSFCCVALLCSCSTVRQKKTAHAVIDDSSYYHHESAAQVHALSSQKELEIDSAHEQQTSAEKNEGAEISFYNDSFPSLNEIQIVKTDSGIVIRSSGQKIKTIKVHKDEKKDSAAAVNIHHAITDTQLHIDSTMQSATDSSSAKHIDANTTEEKRKRNAIIFFVSLFIAAAGYIFYKKFIAKV
ncbi:MAG TPA: hypothetical protein PL045_00685 [Chitinophagaceae bacterium]|nr:hypothetical protein [Chitinophagaceae bacterium]